MQKSIRKQYKINKLKIIAPTWTNQFELPDGSYSVSDIQGYIEHIITNNETLTAIPPIHVYVNRINNRLVFKINDGYKLELQSPETLNLFGSTRVNRQKKTGEKLQYQVLKQLKQFQSNVIQQISNIIKVLRNFTPNKSYDYLLNVEPSNLPFLKTYNTESDDIMIAFTDQNCRLLEIKDKVNLTLLINKLKCDDFLQN